MLQRWDPFGEMQAMRDRLSRLLEEVWGPREGAEAEVSAPAMDIVEREGEYEVRTSLPGVRPEDVEVTASGNTLTVKAERKEEREEKRENYLLRERRAGSFRRTVTLPEPVNPERVEATLEHGVLRLVVPKAEQARPKHIEVKAGG